MPIELCISLTAISAAACTWLFTRHIYLKRFETLRKMTSSISKGEFSSRLNVYSPSEIGNISRELNEVAQEFQERIRQITNDKEKLEAILSSMVEGVLVISSDGKLQHVSPNFRQMLELRSKETENKLYWEVIWNQEINDSIKESLLKKRAFNKEIHIIGAHENFFSMQISPVLDSKGELISLVAIFHDITELKRLEKIRTEFVANVSHELKTPLTSIKGFVETLKVSIKDDPKASERFLDIIAKQTHRLENLVNDLLILSSIESQDIQMTIVPEDLDRVLQSTIQVCRNQIVSQKHDVKIQVPADLPKVLIDRQRMEQVFINLLDNAIKFTAPGGKISITAQKQAEFIRIDVADNGIGIAPQDLPRLFERFYRVDRARSRETGGTGLGLSIVKHIVYAHQGKLSVVSTPSEGTTFSVYLPFASSFK